MIDLPTTRRNLRQRLAVHRVDGCMPVPIATLTALLDALDAADAQVQRVRELVDDQRETKHDHPMTEGYPECPACWVDSLGRALGEEPDDYPDLACLIHDITGEDVPGWEMAECTCPTIRPRIEADTPDPRLHVLARPGYDDYAEIGFGSSGGWNSPNACAYAVGSDVQNYCWETERGMPDPDEIRTDIEGES